MKKWIRLIILILLLFSDIEGVIQIYSHYISTIEPKYTDLFLGKNIIYHWSLNLVVINVVLMVTCNILVFILIDISIKKDKLEKEQ